MQYKKTILKNGLTLITSPLHETKAITALVLLPAGSRHETKEINGASHFIEHLMFKGTKRRPSTLAISKELDGVGASYNAFTYKDHTGYYVKIDAAKAELALDMLSDMLFHSKFDAKEIEKERGVIIEEIKMYEENPLMYIDDFFEQTVFRGHSLGWDIAGPKEVIAKVSRGQIMAYRDSFYRPSNMVLALAGNISDEKAKALAGKYFGAKADSSRKGKSGSKLTESFKKSPIKTGQSKIRVNIRRQKLDQAQLALGFPAYSYFHKDISALSLMGVILGGNMSSRLFIQVREKRGLAYHIGAGSSIYQDVGNFGVYAGLDVKRIEEAIKVILSELKKMKKKEVGNAELKRAKEFLRGKTILSLEDSAQIAGWCGNQELLTGKILTPEEKLEKVGKVTPADVRRVANDVLAQNRLNLALIGPFESEKPFLKLLKI